MLNQSKWMMFPLRKTKNRKKILEVSSIKEGIIRVMRMSMKTKTTLTNNTLLEIINISSWKIISRLWKSRRFLVWILEN